MCIRDSCWMSHNDYIEQAAPGFKITAHTVNCPVAAAENEEKGLYAVQFHPEVLHTAEGKKMLHNFVYNVCGCTGDWKMDSFVENNVEALKKRIGSGKVLCALSGGVDSSEMCIRDSHSRTVDRTLQLCPDVLRPASQSVRCLWLHGFLRRRGNAYHHERPV